MYMNGTRVGEGGEPGMPLWQFFSSLSRLAAGPLTHELQSASAVAKWLQGLRVIRLSTAEVHNLKGIVRGQQ